MKKDSGAVVQALMGRVDWSIEVKGKTPLGVRSRINSNVY